MSANWNLYAIDQTTMVLGGVPFEALPQLDLGGCEEADTDDDGIYWMLGGGKWTQPLTYQQINLIDDAMQHNSDARRTWLIEFLRDHIGDRLRMEAV